jgi:tetratricopeptide (TPR) repeat protein
MDEGLHLARKYGFAAEETWGLYSLGLLNLMQGQFGHALDLIIHGLRIATRIGHREYEVGNRFALGRLYAALFATGPACEQLEGGLALARELCSQTWIQSLGGALAKVYLMLDDLQAAQACLDMVISAKTPMDTLGKRYCWVKQAELALARNESVLSLDITERLIASAPSMSPGRIITYLWVLKAQALAALGQAEEANNLLGAALENVQAVGERFLLWQIHARRGQLYRTMGDQEGAEKDFSVARAQIDELTASITDETLKENFHQGACNVLNLERS